MNKHEYLIQQLANMGEKFRTDTGMNAILCPECSHIYLHTCNKKMRIVCKRCKTIFITSEAPDLFY